MGQIIDRDPISSSASTTANSKIRLLVLDIDGTIVGESNQVGESVKQAVQAARSRGIQVAIATGRMYCSALRFHRDIQATLPLLVYQGALIQDPETQQCHRHWPVPAETAQALLDYFEQPERKEALSVHVYIEDRLYVREMTPATQAYSERCQVEPVMVKDLRSVLAKAPTKVLALANSPNLVQSMQRDLRRLYAPTELYLTRSVSTYFEATHPQASKGAAVRYLAEEMLQLEASNVMAIGDNFNDLEMLKYAGLSVAMGNAPDEIKTIANWVAPDVEHQGAAVAIEKFLLQKEVARTE